MLEGCEQNGLEQKNEQEISKLSAEKVDNASEYKHNASERPPVYKLH